LRVGFALLAGFLACVAGATPVRAQIPSGRDVVSPSALPSFDPVARGGSLQIAVVLKIRDGFHINAREKSADYLIATDLRTEAPAGFKTGDVTYPKGELHSFSFSKKPLNVYEGQVILRMEVTALPDAPVGTQHIPLKLRYQACSNEVCLPPVTRDVDAAVTVASGATRARAAHPELFKSQR
jgi:thiol:disulfide interchange protein DsbD